MKIETPCIFLSFDDAHISAWHELLPFFSAHNMRVTFYISYLLNISGIEWGMIRDFYLNGHTIAHHSLEHKRAGAEIPVYGCKEFMDREIELGLRLFNAHGLFSIKHYAYPYGNGNAESDKCLLQRFSTLRYGGRKYYSPRDIGNTRIIKSANFGKQGDKKYCGHEAFIDESIKREGLIFLYMHTPIRHRLEYLANLGVNFYPMSVLDR